MTFDTPFPMCSTPGCDMVSTIKAPIDKQGVFLCAACWSRWWMDVQSQGVTIKSLDSQAQMELF